MAGRSPLRSGTRDALVSNLDAPDTAQYQADSAGAPGRGLNQGLIGISAGSYGEEANAAELAGDPAAASSLRARALELQGQAQQYGPTVNSVADVNSLGTAAEYAMGGIGSGVATMAPTLAGAALAIGTRGRLRAPLAYAGAAVPGYLMERNEQALSQASDPLQMAQSAEMRRQAMQTKGLVGGALEAIVPGGIGATIGKATGKGFARTVGQNMLEEGATEIAQTRAGQLASQYVQQGGNLNGATVLGEDPMELVDAGILGALTGGAVSAPGAATNVVADKLAQGAEALGELGSKGLDAAKPVAEKAKDSVLGAKDRLSDELDARFRDSDGDLLDKIVNGTNRAVESAKGMDFQSIVDKMKEFDAKRPEMIEQLRERVKTWPEAARAQMDTDNPDSMIAALREKDWQGLADNFKNQAGRLFKGKNNLQRDINPLLQGNAQVALLSALRPEFRDMESVRSSIPELAQRMIALSARTGGLTDQDLMAAVQLRSTLTDIFEDPAAAAEAISSVTKNGADGLSKILEIESASTDASQPNSFLELSLTPSKRAAGFNLKKIGRMVDELALDAEVTPRNRETMRALFGTDEKAEQVLEYYRAKIYDSSSLAMPEINADEDHDTDDFDARLQGINAQDLSEEAAAAPRHFFASAKTKRPFLRGEKVKATGVEDRAPKDMADRARLKLAKALQQARKNGADNSNVRPQIIGHGDYIVKTGGDAAAEVARRTKDANKRKAAALKKGEELKAEGKPEAQLEHERRKVREANKELRTLTMKGEDPRDVLNDLYQVVEVNEVDPSGTKIDDNDVFNMGRSLRQRTDDVAKTEANASTKIDFVGPSGVAISLSAHDIARVTSQKLEKVPGVDGEGESGVQRTRRAFAEGVANLLGAGYKLKEGQDIGTAVVDRRTGLTAAPNKGAKLDETFTKTALDSAQVENIRKMEAENSPAEIMDKAEIAHDELRTLLSEVNPKSPRAAVLRARILAAKTAYDNALRKVFPAPEAQEAEVSQDRTEMDADYLNDLRNTIDEVREYGRRELSMSYLDSLKNQLDRAEKSDARRVEEDTGLAIGTEKRGIKAVQEPSQLSDEDRKKALEQNSATDREDYRNQFMGKIEHMTPSLLVATLRATLRRAGGMGDEDLRYMMAEEVAMMLEREVAIPADLEKQAREFIKQEGVSTGPKKPPEPPKPKKSPFAPRGARSTEGVVRDPALPKPLGPERSVFSTLSRAIGDIGDALTGKVRANDALVKVYESISNMAETDAGHDKAIAALKKQNARYLLYTVQAAALKLARTSLGERRQRLLSIGDAASARREELDALGESLSQAQYEADLNDSIPREAASQQFTEFSDAETLAGALYKIVNGDVKAKKGDVALAKLLIKTGSVDAVKFSIKTNRDYSNGISTTGGVHDSSENSVEVEYSIGADAESLVYGSPLKVVLHEATHAATVLGEQYNPAASKDLSDLLNHVREHAESQGWPTAFYGLTNTQELLAEAFSNPLFQDLLASIPALNTKTFKNAWEELKSVVARILGMDFRDGEATALDEAMTIGLKLVRETAALRSEGAKPIHVGNLFSPGVRLNSQGFYNPAHAWSAADQATVLAEIARQRGPDIKAQFDSFANIGGSGSYTYDAKTGERLIKIAMQSVNPMQVAWHESLHDFMQMMTGDKASTKMSKELLEIANSQPVIRQLRELLKDQPSALAQIETDAEERLAYAYQFFVGGQLRVGTNTKTLFGRIQAFINKLLNTVTTGDRAEAYFANLHAGAFASGSSNVASQVQAMQPTYADRMQKLSDMLGNVGEKLIGSTVQRLRDTNVRALGEVADKFHIDPDQQQGASLKFLQRRAMANGVWANKVFEAMEPASQLEISTALANLQAQKAPSSTLERQISQFLDDMFAYQQKAGVKRLERVRNRNGEWETVEKPLVKEDNYFPRQWDIDAIERNSTGFVAAVDAAGGDGEKVLAAMLGHRDSGKADLQNPDSFTPWNQSLENRVLDFITPANAASFVEFQSRDMADILSTHVNQAVHRAEYARDFGNQGQWLEAKFEEAKGQGATPKDIKLARDAVQGLQGTLQYDMNPKLRQAMAGIITAQNLILLPLSLFSQVVDAMAIGARSNSWGESLKALDAGFKAVARSFTKNADSFTKDERLAMDLGIIDESAMLEAMGMVHHGMYLSKRMKNINRKFFKLNRMEQWNRAMRAQAVVTGQRFILANKDNVRYMDELGLKASDVVETADGGLAMDERDGLSPAQARKMRSAMFKFVDTAVLRPNAAHRPIWGNDPRFMLLMHLKQFSFTFQNTILKHMKKELNFGNAKPALVLMGSIPAIMMSDLAKAAMLGNIPTDMTFMSALGNGVARSGLLGTRAFGVDAGQDVLHGRLPGSSFLGPSFEHATTVAQGLLQVPGTEVSDVAVRSIPGGSLIRDIAKD